MLRAFDGPTVVPAPTPQQSEESAAESVSRGARLADVPLRSGRDARRLFSRAGRAD